MNYFHVQISKFLLKITSLLLVVFIFSIVSNCLELVTSTTLHKLIQIVVRIDEFPVAKMKQTLIEKKKIIHLKVKNKIQKIFHSSQTLI